MLTARYSLDDEERLVEEPTDGTNGRDDKPTEHPEGGNARSLFLLTKDREIINDVVVDPEGAVDSGADKHAAAGPPVEVVELLVAVAGTKDEGQNRVFRAEEEDDRELCKRQETLKTISTSRGRSRRVAPLTSPVRVV